MLFAVDIGNTNIVAGVFAGDSLVSRWRVSTDLRRMSDEYAVLIRALFEADGLSVADVHGAIVCSVVPLAQGMVCEAARKIWGIEPTIVTSDMQLGIEVRYRPRTGVGADRIANAVAAIAQYGVPAIVVDFGTATTFDAISRDGSYIGGAIAPGLEISEEALIAHTAQLPSVSLEPPSCAIGTDTISSLQSGLLYGHAGLVDGLVQRLQVELGGDCRVIATGGLAGVVARATITIEVVDMDLTLRGLKLLYERNS